jgi:hypothetical protein
MRRWTSPKLSPVPQPISTTVAPRPSCNAATARRLGSPGTGTRQRPCGEVSLKLLDTPAATRSALVQPPSFTGSAPGLQHDQGRVGQRERRRAGVLPVRSSLSRRRGCQSAPLIERKASLAALLADADSPLHAITRSRTAAHSMRKPAPWRSMAVSVRGRAAEFTPSFPAKISHEIRAVIEGHRCSHSFRATQLARLASAHCYVELLRPSRSAASSPC